MGSVVLDCNRGDQALTWEAIGALRKAYPDCELAIMADVHDDPEHSQSRQTRRLGVNILLSLLPNPRRMATQDKSEVIDSGWFLAKMKFRAVLDFVQMQILLIFPRSRTLARLLLGKERYKTYEYLRDCNALVIKGGGYIHAYRGLRWTYYIWYSLFPFMLAQFCGIDVIILPNSFGPFDTRYSKRLVRRVLGRCKMVTARERKSLDVLEAIIPGKAKLFPDMGFSLKSVDSNWASKELIGHGVPLGKISCVGVTMRPWRFPDAPNPQEKYEKYIQAFAQLLDHLLGNRYIPVLFAHSVGPHTHEDDRVALMDTLRGTSGAEKILYVDGDYNCRQVKAFYGQMDFMICTRFHSAIFSIAQQVPCLAISYQGYKATGIMEEIELSDFTFMIDDIDCDLLMKAFERLVASQDEVKQKMAIYMKTCQQQLNGLRKLITSEINGKR